MERARAVLEKALTLDAELARTNFFYATLRHPVNSDVGGDAFVSAWSAIPAQITSGHHWITILTAMFMHASWHGTNPEPTGDQAPR